MTSEYVGYDWPKADQDLLLPSFFEKVNEISPSTILDVGCGTGWITEQLAARADFVLGVDCDDYMLGLARSHHVKQNIEYKELPFTSLSLVDRRFDLAVSTLALQMIGSQGGLEHVLGILPSNRFLFVVPHPCAIDKCKDYSRYVFASDFCYHCGGEYEVSLKPNSGWVSFQSRHMPLSWYQNAIAQSDFETKDFREIGGERMPYFIQWYLEK